MISTGEFGAITGLNTWAQRVRPRAGRATWVKVGGGVVPIPEFLSQWRTWNIVLEGNV
jgi:hypothetical protein